MGLDWKYKFRSHWQIDNADQYSKDHQGGGTDGENKDPGLNPPTGRSGGEKRRQHWTGTASNGGRSLRVCPRSPERRVKPGGGSEKLSNVGDRWSVLRAGSPWMDLATGRHCPLKEPFQWDRGFSLWQFSFLARPPGRTFQIFILIFIPRLCKKQTNKHLPKGNTRYWLYLKPHIFYIGQRHL